MKVGIIEDEPLTAQRLVNMLTQYDESIQVQFIVDSNEKLQHQLKNSAHPDLLFSDIELLDGEVFQSYRVIEPKCPIVFTTAFDNYWLEAFQENGISYLLKPFDQEQLAQAIDKYHKLRSGSSIASNLPLGDKDLRRSSKQDQFKKRFVIKRFDGIELLAVSDISLIKVEISGIKAFDYNGSSFPLSEPSLIQVVNKLNPDLFFQLNRNEVVSINAIEKVVSEDKDRLAVSVAGYNKKLIISAQRTPEFRIWLDK